MRVTTTPTNYATFLPIMLRIMLTINITYYAGSSARIIAASLLRLSISSKVQYTTEHHDFMNYDVDC